MFTTIEGVYRNGNVELREKPDGVDDGMPVLVTFLDTGKIDLRRRGIDKKQAAELRGRLATFAEEWKALKWMSTIIMTATNPNYSRGDVVLVLFPHSDLITAKPRPNR